MTFKEFIVNVCGRRETVNRRNDNAVHPAGEEAADDRFFAIGIVQGVGKDNPITEFVRFFFNGQNGPGKNRIGDGGDDEPNQVGGTGAKSLSEGVGDIAHFVGQKFDSSLCGGRDIGSIAKDFRNGHDRNASTRSDVLEANHAARDWNRSSSVSGGVF